ncbi:DUF2442 domain-containing protein [Kamptonema cortianum]|nr:DUF2442 domain-containing protein [Kamptonema cortianum]MDL5050430.1 DUF2442 domain-containing protein [Oscillatoria amoena NRMC-F 0135]
MNSLRDKAKVASYSDGYVTVKMESSLEYRFPIAGNPRLKSGSNADLNTIEISPYGLHWSTLDEDLSFQGIARGDFGQRLG